MANSELRNWKKAAHAAFDPLWKYGPYRGRRNEAYRWLSEKMGTPIEFTHIGMPLFSTDVWYMRRQIAQMNLLFEPKGEPAKIEKTDIKPANLQKSIKNEPKAPENEPLNETKTGQLTFF